MCAVLSIRSNGLIIRSKRTYLSYTFYIFILFSTFYRKLLHLFSYSIVKKTMYNRTFVFLNIRFIFLGGARLKKDLSFVTEM